TGQAIGRLASKVAFVLQGKNKTDYTPNADVGDSVKVTNVSKMAASGKKMEQKLYRHYSGYPGGLKERQLKELMAKNPGEALHHAVIRMLPKNYLRKGMIKRLKISK
ncbi:MAG: 50S ribosomal protein L13, partial [Bacteroidota bacterium]